MLFVRAYPRETQEMVFDAHDRAFALFKGTCRRGIYDNMKTAVETIFVGKGRLYNRQRPYRSYRKVLADVVDGFGERFGFLVGHAEREALVASVASWRPFPDTVGALCALATRYRLAVISNIDDDLFTTTAAQLGVSFDCVVTAQGARSYKPDQAIFELALGRLEVKGHQVCHVAEGVTEISPARRLGCATVWVRRRGRSARLLTEAPDLEVSALLSLLPHVGIGCG